MNQDRPHQPVEPPPGAPPANYAPPPPGYAPPPPGYGAPPWVAPAGPVRPRVLWIVLSWVLFTVVSGAALAWLVLGVVSAVVEAVPGRPFGSGERVSVWIDPGDAPVLYAVAAAPGHVECQIFGASPAGLSLTQPTVVRTVALNGVEWESVFLVGVPRPDAYELVCHGDAERFGVGKDLLAQGMSARATWAGVASLAALLVATVTTVVVSRKRRAARRWPPAAWPGPPPAGPGR